MSERARLDTPIVAACIKESAVQPSHISCSRTSGNLSPSRFGPGHLPPRLGVVHSPQPSLRDARGRHLAVAVGKA
jgi:hypothetical protein